MIFYLALFLLMWSMIFSAARFLQYFRILRNYKEHAVATVVNVTKRMAMRKHEKKAVNVTLEYEIDGKPGRSEVPVESKYAENFALGKEVPIRYYVAENGAVHIASDNDSIKKFMIGHLAAVILEITAFVLIWIYM
ncbi:MAG: hypothetical protein IJ106_10270 [Parasporobacterium sp.]|nr:hypothetical protein [Parasporobacterium sp.]